MKAEIVWTAGAERDLVVLFDQVASVSEDFEVALRLLRQPLDRAVTLLSDNPRPGAPVRGTSIRRILLGPKFRYALFYAEEGCRLMIHALLDMRQDPNLIRDRLRKL
jgi:hypothetical protein